MKNSFDDLDMEKSFGENARKLAEVFRQLDGCPMGPYSTERYLLGYWRAVRSACENVIRILSHPDQDIIAHYIKVEHAYRREYSSRHGHGPESVCKHEFVYRDGQKRIPPGSSPSDDTLEHAVADFLIHVESQIDHSGDMYELPLGWFL